MHNTDDGVVKIYKQNISTYERKIISTTYHFERRESGLSTGR